MPIKCPHWLWYRSGRQPAISMSGRLYDITSTLSAREACPSLVLVTGCRELPKFFSKPKKQSGHICLNFYTGADEPLLLATSSLRKQHGNKFSCCSPDKECQLTTTKYGPKVQNTLYSNLLYPFTDVFCFFSYSNDDLKSIAHQIASWTKQCNADARKQFLPSLLIFLDGNHCLEPLAEIIAENILNRIITDAGHHNLDHYFSTIRIVQIGKGDVFTNLQPFLIEEVRFVREFRHESRQSFSVQHFQCLFSRAFDVLGNNMTSFDPIIASRQDFPINSNFSIHVQGFIEGLKSSRDQLDFAIEVIASSILFDHYPPGMHLFNTADVFKKLYEPACFEAGLRALQLDLEGEILLPQAFTEQVSQHLEQLFQRLIAGESAINIHRFTLLKHRRRWLDIKTNKTCLACLVRHPQYKTACNHWICGNCILVFGESCVSDPWFLRLERCVLCAKDAALYVRVRPPTAGQSILCIDGGGGRGIIPITILCMIEEALGLDIPIQEFFTHVYGSSAGALVLLTLYMEGWSARRCATEFGSLAREAFRPRVESSICKWILALVTGSIYPGGGIAEALQHVHGHQKLTDPSHAHTIGAKIGVLTANTDQPTVHLFNNYNGHGESRVGYCAMEGCETVETWEVAQSSSAAPVYFPAKKISSLGSDTAGKENTDQGRTFCDAGVIQNNPIFLARTEFAALNGDDEPDFILSGGTGFQLPSGKKERKCRPKWLVGLYDALMSCMDGQRDWDRYMGCQKQSAIDRNYRLDFELPEAIGLDNVAAIPTLQSMVYHDKKLNKLINEVIVQVLFPTLFFVDLETLPAKVNSKFNVQAKILCVRAVDDRSYLKISQRFKNSIILVNGKQTPSTFERDENGSMQRSLSFYTGETVLIELRVPGAKVAFPISGSPISLQQLVTRSGLSTYFGQSTHKRRAVTEICSRPRRRRRRLFKAPAETQV